MLIKIELPKDIRILKNENDEIIFEMPSQYKENDIAVSVFSLEGHTVEDFEMENIIGCEVIRIKSNGKFYDCDDDDDDDDDDEN